MIHEFGVEPELAATWGMPSDFRHFMQAFGLGTTRVISRFPSSWKRLVWDAAKPSSELERKRLEELLIRLSETMVRRHGSYDPRLGWVENALADNARSPFACVLARNGDDTGPIIGVGHLDESAAWKCPNGTTCPRTAAALAAALAPALRICRRVAFIDPHFGPENARHRRPLEAFLRVLVDRRPGAMPEEVLVLTSIRSTVEFFVDECQKHLPRVVPSGMQVVVRRLKQREQQERLHNRYVLTDVGGVSFGVGLDDGDPTQNDDLNVLSAEQFAMRKQQYLGPTMDFDLPEADLTIVGIA